MSKNEFLNQLSQLLTELSPDEKEEALAYYREYIEDAGEENEEAVMRELGSPVEIAEEIKAGLFTKATQRANTLQPVNNPHEDAREQFYREPENHYNQFPNYSNVHRQYQQTDNTGQNSNSTILVLALVVLVLVSPIWVPALLSVLGVIISIVIAGIIGGIACIIAGVALLVWGIIRIATLSPLTGFALLGAGLLVTVIGILLLLLGIWLCATAIPWAIKEIRRIFSRLIHKKEAAL